MEDKTLPVPFENNGTITYHTTLSPEVPNNLLIKESYLDGNKQLTTDFKLPFNGEFNNYFNPSKLLNDSNGLDNIDTNKSRAIYLNNPDDFRSIAEIRDGYLKFAENPKQNPSLIDLLKFDYMSDTVSGNGLINHNVPNVEYDIVYKKGGVIPTESSHGDSAPSPTITDFNQTVATFGDRPAVQVYNTEGNRINEIINPDVDWHSDKKMLLNGTTYYSLKDDKWVKDSDAYIFFAKNADVRTYQGNYVKLTDGNNGKILNRGLQAGSDWYTDRIAILDGEKYYRVATSEFVKAPAVYEYKYDSRVVQTNKNTIVYDELGNIINIKLPFLEYKSDIAVTINGNTYHRIATNLFIRADNI